MPRIMKLKFETQIQFIEAKVIHLLFDLVDKRIILIFINANGNHQGDFQLLFHELFSYIFNVNHRRIGHSMSMHIYF